MKKDELVVKVQEGLESVEYKANKKEVGLILDTVFKSVFDAVVDGEEVPVGDLGKLTSAERAARKGRNPQTGEEIEIPATLAPKFKPSKGLKEALKSK